MMSLRPLGRMTIGNDAEGQRVKAVWDSGELATWVAWVRGRRRRRPPKLDLCHFFLLLFVSVSS